MTIQLHVFLHIALVTMGWRPHYDPSIRSQATVNQSSVKETDLLLLSAVVSGINLLLPGFFNICAWIENHDSPSAEVYVSIFR